MLIHADILFDYARRAYLDIGDEIQDRDLDQRETVPVIIFSVAASEAFINEVGALAIQDSSLPHQGQDGRLFASMWEELGDRSSLKAKFILAKTILTQQPYDRKVNPYRDFSYLVTLRDALVHMIPRQETKIEDGQIKINPWDFVEQCLPKQILADCDPEVESWIVCISTKAAARWACTTTESMIESLMASVQDNHLRSALHVFFRGKFALPDPPHAADSDK